MAALRGQVLAVALIAAGLSLAAGQSFTQCPLNQGVVTPAEYTYISAAGEIGDTLRQVLQWCRYSENGLNANYTNGTRAWGNSTGSARGSLLGQGNTVLTASNGFNGGQLDIGIPGARTASNGMWNATCDPYGTPTAGDLDGKGGATYLGGSPACAVDEVSQALNPTTCQTDDNWGSNTWDASGVTVTPNPYCMVPGNDLTMYPTTYNLNDVCNRTVLKYDLVDQATRQRGIGQLLVFKDYFDNLFMTVLMNATYRVMTQTPVDDGTTADFFNGQYLHVQPNLLQDGSKAGMVAAWTQYPGTNNYPYTDMLQPENGMRGIYSCFTYKINTRSLCNPLTSYWNTTVGGCMRYDGNNTQVGDVVDASDPSYASQLFLKAQFLVTNFHMSADTGVNSAARFNITGNYSANIKCPGSDPQVYYHRLAGCGCYDLNENPPAGRGYALPGTLWVVPKSNPLISPGNGGWDGVVEVYQSGLLPQSCHLLPRPSPLPSPVYTPSPSPGPSPSPSPPPVSPPVPSPIPSPLYPIGPTNFTQFQCQVTLSLDPEFFNAGNIPFTGPQLMDAVSKTFNGWSAWYSTIAMQTPSLLPGTPTVGYELLFYFNSMDDAVNACNGFRNMLPVFIWYAGLPCGTNVQFALNEQDPSFPTSNCACFATEAGVLSVEALCLKPKGNQICVTPVAAPTSAPGYSPVVATASPSPMIEVWPSPDQWYEYLITTPIRSSNGLQDIATGNVEGTINKVVQNVCPYLKNAMLDALQREGAPAEAYILKYGDEFQGCGDVLVQQPQTSTDVPLYVYMKVFLNISSVQFDRMKKKFAPMQGRKLIAESHIICGSNVTWSDVVSNPTAPPKTIYTQRGLPWLRPTYQPLSCKVTVGL